METYLKPPEPSGENGGENEKIQKIPVAFGAPNEATEAAQTLLNSETSVKSQGATHQVFKAAPLFLTACVLNAKGVDDEAVNHGKIPLEAAKPIGIQNEARMKKVPIQGINPTALRICKWFALPLVKYANFSQPIEIATRAEASGSILVGATDLNARAIAVFS